MKAKVPSLNPQDPLKSRTWPCVSLPSAFEVADDGQALRVHWLARLKPRASSSGRDPTSIHFSLQLKNITLCIYTMFSLSIRQLKTSRQFLFCGSYEQMNEGHSTETYVCRRVQNPFGV